MSDLKVRKIPFEFEGVDFLWNPSNPAFSIKINQISFWVLGLEKYLCMAMKDAEPHIKDAEVLEEARLFKFQEAQHSLSHRRHVNALIEKYPGLKGTLDKVIGSYMSLYKQEDLKFHLAYGGGLEATFTAHFKMIIDNRGQLFRDGDSRVASLNLWHFCEEIEHRSSALVVYNDVVGSYWYRLRQFPKIIKHVKSCLDMLAEEFKIHVPEVPPEYYDQNPFSSIPFAQRYNRIVGILGSQMPWHDPEHQPLPNWSHKWFRSYDNGEDMSNYYGTRPSEVEA